MLGLMVFVENTCINEHVDFQGAHLTLISAGGGAPRAPPSRYWSAVSTWFEITSSRLVTFIFKTFPKNRATQF